LQERNSIDLKGEIKEGKNSFGCVDSEGHVKNQDKVG